MTDEQYKDLIKRIKNIEEIVEMIDRFGPMAFGILLAILIVC